jgi:hypothetical protein
MHDYDIAVYVFANFDHTELRHAIMYKAIYLYVFDHDSRDWNKEIFNLYAGFNEEAKEGIRRGTKNVFWKQVLQ